MLIYKAFRYRIYPTKEQEARMGRWNDALRFLWNLALEQRLLGMSRTDKRYPSAVDQSRELTDLRRVLPWLADVPRNVSRQLLDELEMAFQRCFKRLNGLPHWKSRGRDFLGLCEPNGRGWRLDGSNLRFPKLGILRTVMHRPIEGTPRMCTLKREGDQWFASIVCGLEIADPTPRTQPVLAIDRGVTNLPGAPGGSRKEKVKLRIPRRPSLKGPATGA